MDTTALAISLVNCTDQAAQEAGHDSFIESKVIDYLRNNPQLIKTMLVKWQAANPGLGIYEAIPNGGLLQLDFSK
jgi:hypothetical protein